MLAPDCLAKLIKELSGTRLHLVRLLWVDSLESVVYNHYIIGEVLGRFYMMQLSGGVMPKRLCMAC